MRLLPILICVLSCGLCLGIFFVVHILSPWVVAGVFLAILICRRKDILGGLLFISMLSIGTLLIMLIVNLILLPLPLNAGWLSVLIGSLYIIKEFQRFLDNEYAEGITLRRILTCLIGIAIAVIQILLLRISVVS